MGRDYHEKRLYLTWETYKYADGKYDKLTKYCNKSRWGNNDFTDNLAALQSSDDPATVNWGTSWQTPSKDQWEELLNNTNNTWTTRNGVNGTLFTSKKNGRTLFLPAVGNRWDTEFTSDSYGRYWSGSLYTDYAVRAWNFNFASNGCCMGESYRYYGHAVRPVRQK